jgi:hypothetical protein
MFLTLSLSANEDMNVCEITPADKRNAAF